jgi:TRAP-type mannitol/chloroaromatic compound transport system permease small subunit
MEKLCDLIDRINTWAGRVAGYLILFLMAFVVYEVGSRYLFNSPTKWSSELSQYMLAAVVLLSGGFCLIDDGHVRVDILYRNFKPGTRALVEMISFVMICLFAGAMVWKGGELCWDAFVHNKKSMTIMEMPLFPSMVMVPVGAVLLGLQSLARTIRAFMKMHGTRGVGVANGKEA